MCNEVASFHNPSVCPGSFVQLELFCHSMKEGPLILYACHLWEDAIVSLNSVGTGVGGTN